MLLFKNCLYVNLQDLYFILKLRLSYNNIEKGSRFIYNLLTLTCFIVNHIPMSVQCVFAVCKCVELKLKACCLWHALCNTAPKFCCIYIFRRCFFICVTPMISILFSLKPSLVLVALTAHSLKENTGNYMCQSVRCSTL